MVVRPVRLLPRPRGLSVGVELGCGHTVWGDTALSNYDIWLACRTGLWCPTCDDGYPVAGVWRPRG